MSKSNNNDNKTTTTRRNDLLYQGDVIFQRIDALPTGLTKAQFEEVGNGNLILQYSETSGNHHHFKAGVDVELFQARDTPILTPTITPDYQKYIVVGPDGAELFHGKGFEHKPSLKKNGDHDSFILPEGIYQIGIVPEVSDEGKILNVVD